MTKLYPTNIVFAMSNIRVTNHPARVDLKEISLLHAGWKCRPNKPQSKQPPLPAALCVREGGGIVAIRQPSHF